MAFWNSKSDSNENAEKGKSIIDVGKDLLKRKNKAESDYEDVEYTDKSILTSSKEFISEGAMIPVRAAIKGSGKVIRKIYEARINVVNEFSDITPDWCFVDSDTVNSNIVQLEKELQEEIKKLKKNNSSIKNITNIIEKILVANALLPNNIAKCKDIIKENDLNTPFAKHGLSCIEAHESGDYITAIEQAEKYYDLNNGEIEHPLIGLYIAEFLTKSAEYEKALSIMPYVVKSYPECKKAHQLLIEIHTNLGNSEAVKLEESIVSLL